MQFKTMLLLTASAALAVPGLAAAQSSGPIPVGHLADYSGATSDVGVPYGQGVADAMNYISKQNGIGGRPLAFETVDYSYQVPRAVATYKKLTSQNKVVAIQGWGTADTEALVTFVANDKVPYFSGSYSGALTDPKGQAPRSDKAAPYNFFYGPSYSDAARAMVQWAMEDWKKGGKSGKPKYVHMGANHPYPNSPKAASEELAKELGFDVLPAIQYSLAPADFTAQCLTLKESGANYAYLGNTGGSNISLLKACETAGVKVQFIGNVWGMDENVMKAVGKGASGTIFPVRTAVLWGNTEAPGMKLAREISNVSDSTGAAYRAVHYLSAICSTYYMKEAMEWAAANGGITGENIKKGMYQKKDWVPAGLEGVCQPSTWTESDHRGTTRVSIYRAIVNGATDAPLNELMANGTMKIEKVTEIDVPRKPEWQGW